MSSERYLSSTQQTVLSVYVMLHEQPLAGMSTLRVAQRCDISRDQAFRALHNLAHQGLAQQGAGFDATWRLTRRAAALSERMRDALMAAHIGA